MASTDSGALGSWVKQVSERLNGLRDIRMARMREIFSSEQKNFLDLLPLLFHTNQPGLPGYVSRDCPSDIHGYTPAIGTVQLARNLCPDIELDWKIKSGERLAAVYLVGKAGTVDQSPDDCLDVWVCHTGNLSETGLKLLSEKARLVQQFAYSSGVDVTVRIVSDADFRDPATNPETGTAFEAPRLFAMLEAFYRSSVLLAGLYPLWWLVPGNAESNYSAYVSRLVKDGHVTRRDWLDFGCLSRISVDAFVRECCHSIDTAIDARDLHLLPVMVYTGYAHDWEKPRWLCQEVKEAIQKEVALESLGMDASYLCLKRIDPGEDADFVRACFYRSGQARLSLDEEQDWRHKALRKLSGLWGWSEEHLEHLDNPKDWTIEDVRDIRSNTADAIRRAHEAVKQLLETANDVSEATVRSCEAAGRKLAAAYGEESGFVELLDPHRQYRLHRDEVFIHYADGEWQARTLPPLSKDSALLATGNSMVEILVWLHVNGVASGDTRIQLPAVLKSSLEIEHERIFASLSDDLTAIIGVPRSLGPFFNQPAARASLVYINVGFDPMAKLTEAGLHRATERPDPLSFSGTHENLVVTLDHLQVNSWGQVSLVRYSNKNGGLLSLLCSHLDLALTEADKAPLPLKAYCFTSPKADDIVARVSDLAEHICGFFRKHGEAGRYTLRMEDTFYLIESGTDGYQWSEVGDKVGLIRKLRDPEASQRPLMVDPVALQASTKPGNLQSPDQ